MIKVVKKILEKINLIGIAMMITAQAAFADSISSTKLATGTTNLIQDVTAWIIGLGSGVTILMVIYCLLRRNMADEMDHKKWQTRMIVSFFIHNVNTPSYLFTHALALKLLPWYVRI